VYIKLQVFEVEVIIGTVFKNLTPGPSPKERGDLSGGNMSTTCNLIYTL